MGYLYVCQVNLDHQIRNAKMLVNRIAEMRFRGVLLKCQSHRPDPHQL